MQHVAETTACQSGGSQDSRSRSYPLNKDSLKIFQTFFFSFSLQVVNVLLLKIESPKTSTDGIFFFLSCLFFFPA